MPARSPPMTSSLAVGALAVEGARAANRRAVIECLILSFLHHDLLDHTPLWDASVTFTAENLSGYGGGSDVESKQHDVAILDDVLLSLRANDTLFARTLPSAVGD